MVDLATLDRAGLFWFRDALSALDLKRIEEAIELDGLCGERIADARLQHDHFGPKSKVGRVVASFDSNYRPVRVVGFDKSASKNWGVDWHQDRVIAVQQRRDLEGFQQWSLKAGIPHCCPPEPVLRDMLFVRVHLDDVTAENGPMEIAIRSHRAGVLSAGKVAGIIERAATDPCYAQRGDILILPMLTAHRSQPSRTNVRRRAIRIDYARHELPSPLEWFGQSEW